MEIPSAILKNLQCSNCEAYLSCAPVLMKDDGESLCGRCVAPETGFRQNKPYEELAQLMKFPCKYEENGCTQLLLFSQNKSHEDACEYRPYICPVAPSGKCAWIGRRADLLEHCRKDHCKQVAQNPCVLKHQIIKTSLDTFLISAFSVLFLIHAKVCVNTKKIYHSVRLIGDPACAEHYEYKLDIDRKGAKISKRKEVSPQGCLALQENTSLTTGINGVLEILGGFSETTFTLRIEKIFEDVQAFIEKEYNPVKEIKLNTDISGDNTNWVTRKCKYNVKGCMYEDTVNKMEKHELYFCQYSIRCSICARNIFGIDLIAHYTKIHNDIIYRDGIKWVLPIFQQWHWCLISCEFGYVLCNHWQDENGFHIRVFSALEMEQLKLYKCEVELSRRLDGHKCVRKLQVKFNNMTDWFAEFSVDEFKSCVSDKIFNIKIQFTKRI